MSMTLPDDFWTRHLHDEPCDGCGARPSKHLGHGSFTCKACHYKRWCPKCSYILGPNHVCPDEAERARLAEEDARVMAWLSSLEAQP